MKKKVMLGISGGVDSAVSAYLLKEQGYDVRPVFMRNWHSERDHCTATEDLKDAESVCKKLGLDLDVIDFSKDYWDRVFVICLDELAQGRTPNPDILCNSEIKFKAFLDHAKAQGVDDLATGHYARTQVDEKRGLFTGLDAHKDQSYFLYRLPKEVFAQALFPCGALEKKEVRSIASSLGLSVADKKDSTGICFIGEKNYRQFISSYLLDKPGPIVSDQGRLIGEHQGIMYYTMGQRQGLNIGGLKGADQAPWYVAEKRLADQTLIVTQDPQSPLLWHKSLQAIQLHWIDQAPKHSDQLWAKIRYQQKPAPCRIEYAAEDETLVHFDAPQRAITPGQHIVFYQGCQCLGGGVISHALR